MERELVEQLIAIVKKVNSGRIEKVSITFDRHIRYSNENKLSTLHCEVIVEEGGVRHEINKLTDIIMIGLGEPIFGQTAIALREMNRHLDNENKNGG